MEGYSFCWAFWSNTWQIELIEHSLWEKQHHHAIRSSINFDTNAILAGIRAGRANNNISECLSQSEDNAENSERVRGLRTPVYEATS